MSTLTISTVLKSALVLPVVLLLGLLLVLVIIRKTVGKSYQLTLEALTA